MTEQKKRETELDILRFISTLAVIMTHLCGGPVKSIDIYSFNWSVLNCLRAAVTWDVPVFVMISGCLFLDPKRDVSIKLMYKKYIKHIVICFCIWSAIFQVWYYYTGHNNLNWKGIISQFLVGPYPFWYLFMLVGYMVVPFLKQFTSNKVLLQYFLLLFILMEFVANYGISLPYIGAVIAEIFNKATFHFTLGFTGYYMLGYYLVTYKVSDKLERILYVLGILCVFFSCFATTWQSRLNGVYTEWFSKYLMPNVIVESAAIFTFFVKRVSRLSFSPLAKKIWEFLTIHGFGVYLVHALIIEMLNLSNITVISASPLVMVPMLTIIVYLISLLLTWLIRKLPVVGKKIT